MAKIYIDDRPYEVDAKNNLLDAVLSLGINLPYFCWHPAMGSVGACRQCAVIKFKDENDKKGRIVMACMEQIEEGMRISVEARQATEFRASVIELLMTNHPHDCPVCDEGGECHLQDMTTMTGHDYRRFRYHKRTYRNQNLGPFINHEMNRCIQCYRCVRFYRDYAGGRDLHALASKNHTYFGRFEDGTLESEFSGNLVEVCPTGVFTDKTLKKHYTRKWDLTTAPSICHHCGLGCNIIAGERYGSLRRILSRYNGQVNGYFICDRGRFGYEFVNSQNRIRQALRRGEASKQLEPLDKGTILNSLGKILEGSKEIIGIGSPRASLEANFALQKLVGKENFYLGISGREHRLLDTILEILRNGPARTPSLKEVEKADAVFILGEDITNTAPMLALAVRQAIRQKPMETSRKLNIPDWDDAAVQEATQEQKGPLFVAAPFGTRLDDVATATYRATPDDIARLGFAVAHQIEKGASGIADLPADVRALVKQIAEALKNAEKPLLIAGTASHNEAILHAAANITRALYSAKKEVSLSFTVPEVNSLGLAMLGGKPLSEAFERAHGEDKKSAIILENNLYRRAQKKDVDAFFENCKNVITLDAHIQPTAARSYIVIPVGTFAENDGTVVSSEGRAQRFYQVYAPQDDVQESWRWLAEISAAIGQTEPGNWKTFDEFTAALVAEMPDFGGIDELAPPPGFRVAGQKIPRQPHRFSGRTAMHANVNVSEPKPPEDPDSALSFTMEGYRGKPPSSIIPFFWSPGWNSAQSINKFQIEVGGGLHGGDPGKRLIEAGEKSGFESETPPPFAAREDEFLLLPVYHIFGSEELSSMSPAIAERAPQPYLALNPADAEKRKISEGKEIEFSLGGNPVRLPVIFRKEIPGGIAGMAAGLPKTEWAELPQWVKLGEAGK